MQENISQFGKLVQQYDAIRPLYPDSVIKMVREAIKEPTPFVLDLGCGTGISTRQVAEAGAFTIGCDIDAEMVGAALSHPQMNTAYVVSAAGELPFSDDTFNAVTIFTALHWFSDETSLMEIKRVLTKDGVICAVHVEHTAPFAGDHRRLITEAFPEQDAPHYERKDFAEALRTSGFQDVAVQVVQETNEYSLDNYLTLIQSYSVWNRVPDSKKEEMLTTLSEHFTTKLVNGSIHDTLDIKVITGQV